VARKIDEQLYHDTKSNLRAAAKGDEELLALVEEQLDDMQETGYFDLEDKYKCLPRYDEDDHFERNIL
jgi:hypothetical protein